VKVATVGLLAWAVLSPDLPQFQGKAFAGRAIAYPIALLALPILWGLLARHRIPFPVAAGTETVLTGVPWVVSLHGFT